MTFRIRVCRFWIMAAAMGCVVVAGGCITHSPDPAAATQPATAIDPAQAEPTYWLDQPAVACATHADFETLWSACEDVLRDYLLEIDRVDYRLGLLTAEPRISPQFFELWRKDIGTNYGVAQSSLATIRRTAIFDFSRDQSTGQVIVQPKVLVERQSQPERRITSVVQYRSALSPNPAERGSRERDSGIDLPSRPYWYATGRDNELEAKLAKKIQQNAERKMRNAE